MSEMTPCKSGSLTTAIAFWSNGGPAARMSVCMSSRVTSVPTTRILPGGREAIKQTMGFLLYLVIGIVFTAFAALVFSVLTLILGKFFSAFEVSGPDGWQFSEFYIRYLIIAAVYTFVSLPLGNGILTQLSRTSGK